jgi:isopentenyl diphosphate isomerase/L-lactate dehydrogenase-like FMN-dependent dehydrogenase
MSIEKLLWSHDATGLAELVHKGEIEPRELVDAAIARAERVNPEINAIAEPLFERARELALKVDRKAPFAGVPFALSTVGSRTIEEVAAVAGDAPRWFQLYVTHDRNFNRSLVERAEAAGYRAMVVTVDLPVLSVRDVDARTGFDIGAEGMGHFTRDVHGTTFQEILSARFATDLSWTDVEAIRSWTSLPVAIKGILTPVDARLAVEHGAAGVVVSNHGGRQPDRVAPAIDALPGVVEAVAGRAEVYLDGGVRRGTDVVTALALGARAVFAARPFLYALAGGGEQGVHRAFEILRQETEIAMALLGTPRVSDIGPDHVRRRD